MARKRTYKKSSARRRDSSRSKPSRPHVTLNSILLLLFGVGLFMLGNVIQYPTYPTPQISAANARAGQSQPIHITINKIGLSVPVIPGGIVGGQWILSDTSAHYLPTSGAPGEGYNTVIYAHRLQNLFGDLYKLAAGDTIVLTDSEEKTLYYTVNSLESVSPSDTGKLISFERNSLTLFTCDGWYDQNRLIVRAILAIPGMRKIPVGFP